MDHINNNRDKILDLLDLTFNKECEKKESCIISSVPEQEVSLIKNRQWRITQ